MNKNIGVLAVQGAFQEHIYLLKQLGANCIEIRQKNDLYNHNFDGLILPGGESTVMGKLLRELDIFESLREMILNGIPVLATCAGLILLAKNIINDNRVYLRAMDIHVKRNAYGRQLGSFNFNGCFKGIGEIPMVFIRAPYIECVGSEVEVLATVDDRIVAAKQKNMIVTAFHPELTNDSKVHSYFLEACNKKLVL